MGHRTMGGGAAGVGRDRPAASLRDRAPGGWDPVAAVAALEGAGPRPALILAGDPPRTVTAAALASHVRVSAARLAAVGLKPGELVALHGPNGADWIAAALACGWMGLVLAPLDALTPPAEARAQAAAMGARLMLSDAAAGPERAVNRLAVLPLAAPAGPVAPAPAPVLHSPDDPLALFRTSGTTGAPKLFTLGASNIGAVVDSVSRCGLLRAEDRVLMPLPLHHVYPWITATLSTLWTGGVLILPRSAAGPDIAAALRAHRPSVIVGVPRLHEAFLAALRGRARALGRLPGAAFDALLAACVSIRRRTGLSPGRVLFAPLRRAAAPGLRLLVSGGARLEPDVAEALEALGWDVRPGYGLSETASMIAGALFDKRAGTEGRVMPGAELRIDAPDAAGVGEIVARGPGVFAGYIDNPVETACAFTPDGFFRTGDLGRLDADGFLTVIGRKKELIVLGGGENLFPEDVERRYEADPSVAEIGVFERDGRLLGLVRPEMTAIGRHGVLQAERAVRVALSGAAAAMPSTWRLAGFAITREPLPRTRLGKLRRFLLPALHDRASSGTHAPTRPLTAEEARWVAEAPRAAVWRMLARERPDRAFDLDSHLQLDLGLDSFGWMTLAVAIEHETGVRLDPARIAGIATVRDLMAAVSDAAARARPAPAASAAARDARWTAPRSPFERAAGALVAAVVAGLMRLLFGVRAIGVENIPPRGPVLLCPNHASDIDPLALAAALPAALRPRLRWAADRRRAFGHPLLRPIARWVGLFPVDETEPLAAVRAATDALVRGEVQIWFPEGWRSADGRLLRFQPGVGLLAARARAPVVPVFIEGAFAVWPRSRRLPRPGRITVTFGPAVAPETLAPGGDLSAAAPQEIADALRAAVLAVARSRGVDAS